MRRPSRAHEALVVAVLTTLASREARAIEPFRSMKALPSSNGRGTLVYDPTTTRVTQLLEHAYRYPAKGASETRNFAYDSYPGIRVGGTGTWLTSVAPKRISYVPGTGIVHVERSFSGLEIDEYQFAPMGLAENASVTIVKVKRTSGGGNVDVHALFNFHLGSGAPTPGANGEQALYVASRDAIYEWGPSGKAIAYGSIGPSSHHGMTPSSPYASLLAGQDLADNVDTGGAKDDVAAGLERSLGDLAIGGEGVAGFYTVLDHAADAQGAADRVRTWLGTRTPATVLADEIAGWAAWHKPFPTTLPAEEIDVAKQALATIRMAQVTEAGGGKGQILASLAPGRWNIAWVRDMAYAVVALARSGHVDEARAAIDFQMKATVGEYQSYVGKPYRISVVRYFGDGVEESDSNEDGPNVEFDGFGLFLWELEEYARASGDTAFLGTHFPKVSSEIADVLVHLQEASGLMAPDSSIWEVHWKGKQRHFAYTTITAANGLCRVAALAKQLGNDSLAQTYLAAGIRARDAILTELRAPDLTVAQSTEGLAAKAKFLDASTVEALNFGLLYPNRKTARATLASYKAGLVPPSGRGFMRSDVGGWYDSQEWVFVDFRTTLARRRAGDLIGASAQSAWNVGQARENFDLFSELHDRVTAEYVGEAPMVGFGAASFLLEAGERDKAIAPACGSFAEEPADPISDAGTYPDGGPIPPNDDAGTETLRPPTGDDSSCGCRTTSRPTNAAAFVLATLSLFGLSRRRRRESRR